MSVGPPAPLSAGATNCNEAAAAPLKRGVQSTAFVPGDVVAALWEGDGDDTTDEWWSATVLSINNYNNYNLLYADGSSEAGVEHSRVRASPPPLRMGLCSEAAAGVEEEALPPLPNEAQVRPRPMPLKGERVSVKFDEGWFLGRIAAVLNPGRIAVHYDDGEYEETDFPTADIQIVDETEMFQLFGENDEPAHDQAAATSSAHGEFEGHGEGQDDNDDGLCEYERERLERVARNDAMLKSLGLDQGMIPKKPPPKPRARVKKPTPQPQEPTRASGRASAAPDRFAPSVGRRIVIVKAKSVAWSDEEVAALQRGVRMYGK